jgi:hypothetical protein
MKNIITYREIKNYKFQLKNDYVIQTGIEIPETVITPDSPMFIELSEEGVLTIRGGYAWDGASGPAINTKTIIRGSLLHDALYQLIRAGKLDKKYREKIDQLFRDICIEDGMWRIRANWVYFAVRKFASFAVKKYSGAENKIHTAP